MQNFNYLSFTPYGCLIRHPLYDDEIFVSNSNNYLTVNGSQTEIPERIVNPIINYFNSLSSKSTIQADTGILPPGLIHVDNQYVIFERPPTYQNIQLIPATLEHIDEKSYKKYIFRLPIPWTVYFVSYSIYNGAYYPYRIAMYFMANSLQGSALDSHRLYLPPLVNFYNNSTLCNPMFDSMDEVTRYENNVSGVINAAYNWIWNTGSNLDLTTNIVECIIQGNQNSYFPSSHPFHINNIGLSNYAISSHSYYIEFPYIARAFQNWEKISIDQISSISWPNPCTCEQVHHHIHNIGTSMLLDYFRDHDIDPLSVALSPEESEETGNLYHYNEFAYYNYLRKLQSPPLYFNQAAETFASNTQVTFQDALSLDKIISNVFLTLSSLL